MSRALDTVEQEYRTANKSLQFELLRQWLAGDSVAMTQAEAARQLGWTETAVKVAIHRLRKRFRHAVRTEIAQTTAEANEVDTELKYLIEVFSCD
jgi:DNA-binding CsgD family transcriptional regulator